MRIIIQTHHDTRADKWGLVHISLISGPGSQLWRWQGRWLAGSLARLSKKFPRPGTIFGFGPVSVDQRLCFPRSGRMSTKIVPRFIIDRWGFLGWRGGAPWSSFVSRS